MKISLKGCTRIVILIGNYAIKIPNFKVSHLHFLYGCYSNYSERSQYKNIKKNKNNKFSNLIAPSIFCTWFGLIQIQKRCIELERHLTEEEKEIFKDICFDIKKENFGYYKNNLVCFDFAK